MRKISGLLLGIAAISMVGYLSAGITIIEAKYGILNNKKKTKNVTEKLQNLVNGKSALTIPANGYNKLFGDPAKKKAKQLYVKYNDGKAITEKTVGERESITFAAIMIARPPEPKPKPELKPEHKPIPEPAEPSDGPTATIVNDYDDPQEILLIKFETPGSQGRQDIFASINGTLINKTSILTPESSMAPIDPSNWNGEFTKTLQPGESISRRFRVGFGGADNSGKLVEYLWIFKHKYLSTNQLLRLPSSNIKIHQRGKKVQTIDIQK